MEKPYDPAPNIIKAILSIVVVGILGIAWFKLVYDVREWMNWIVNQSP